MACRGLFVTGTDTSVGKTLVATALLRTLAAAGLRAVGMKPVAAGFDAASGANADVLALRAAGNVDAPVRDCNPYAFADPVAPHLAAQAAGVTLELSEIAAAGERLRRVAEALIVEGAGGVLVPLDARHDMLDIAAALDLPVLLVVGMRLGCLNHALLTALAVRRRGLDLRGWVANGLPPPMALAGANIRTLTDRLGCAPIAVVDPGAAPTFDAKTIAMLGF
ncbi:MAG TPA: dethiobiotin synthase [Casimicrobiaceae bacterium]